MGIKQVVAVASAAFVAFTLSAEVVYQNDFSTRTSKRPVPDGVWHEFSYKEGNLAYNYSGKPTAQKPYNSDDIQDNWFKARFSADNDVVSSIASNSSNAGNKTGDSNMFLRFGHSSSVSAAMSVAQSFYNSFSNGVLRIACDLRAPTNWPSSGTGFIRVQPLFRAALATPNWTDVAARYYSNWGLQISDKDKKSSQAVMLFAYKQGKDAGLDRADVENRHWYRFVMNLDLTKGKISGNVYDQGESHPNMNDSLGQVVMTDDRSAYWDIAHAEAGPIEGIGIRTVAFKSVSPVDHYTEPCCDNLVCEWKSPDSDSFVRFYENDFSTRRYRTICPPSATECVYQHGQAVTEMVYKPYAYKTVATYLDDAESIVPDVKSSGTGRQSIGLNGWRRANAGDAEVAVAKYGDNPMLRFRRSGGGGYAIATQKLDEKISSGKVRFTFDFRLPDKWNWNYYGIWGSLGPEKLWGASQSDLSASTGTRLGIGLPSGAEESLRTNFYGYHQTTSGITVDQSVSFVSNQWYRGVIVADLDTRKCNGKLFLIGKDPVSFDWQPTAAPVYDADYDMRDGVTSFEALAIAAYAVGGTTTAEPRDRHYVFFDNLGIWKDWDASSGTGTLVYKDEFDNVTRGFAAQNRGTLTGSLQMDDGQDHWILRGTGVGDTWITSGANPCMAAASVNSSSYAVHALGSNCRRGKVVCEADIRPPRSWSWDTHYAFVVVGGDYFFQGNVGKGDGKSLLEHTYGLFGFGDPSGYVANGVWTDVKFRFYDGAKKANVFSTVSIDKTHWYRFRATFDTDVQTYDVDVFDMGTEHPDVTTEDGLLVDSVKGLGFRGSVESVGVSSVGLCSAATCVYTPSDPEDPGIVLYDNIRVNKETLGTAVILR